MRLRFLWVGSTKESGLAALEKAYLQRISRFVPNECVVVPELKKSDLHSQAEQLRKEEASILARIRPGSFLIALDERGEELTSPRFAELLQEKTQGSYSEICFLVGGFLGFTDDVRRRADCQLAISKMTLTHELARVLLLEQVFRAFAILNGLPYHR